MRDYFPDLDPEPAEDSAPTFCALLDQWIASISHLAKGTRIKYEQAAAWWRARLGEERIDGITYGRLIEIIGGRSWPSAKHRNNMLIPMRRVFRLARLDGHIREDPTERIEHLRPQRRPPDPFSLEEVSAILADMREHYPAPVANYFTFMFFAGLRPEEAIALRWADIDWRMSTARIERVRTAGEDRDSTKTGVVRDVELLSPALAALQAQKAHTFMQGLDAPIFCNPVTGRAWNSEQAQRRAYWTPCLRRLGIRYRRPYQTRHTFATTCIMGGANPVWVARQLGHATVQMTLQVYAKWINLADRRREADRVEKAIAEGFAPSAPQASKAGGEG